MSIGQEHVLLMTRDVAVAAAVDMALAYNGRTWVKTNVLSAREVLLHLGRSSSPVVLVDLEPQPLPILAELERISARHPEVRIVALSSALDPQLLLSAMQSGVRHVLLRQQIGTELTKLLYRLTSSAPVHAVERGNLFVVLSAGGGCGSSTLAANLGEELAAQSHRPTLVMDLDLSYGALACMLGVEPRYGIDYVLGYDGAIDVDLIRSTASKYNDNVHLLPSPAGAGVPSPELPNIGRLEHVLDAAMQAYRNVVVDAPRLPADVAAMLAAASTRTLLAMQLNVKDVRVARALLAALSERGVPSASIVPLVTRYARRQHTLSLEDASKALGGLRLECTRSDYRSASRALDFGQMLASAAPRSPLRRDIQDLAAKITPPAKTQA